MTNLPTQVNPDLYNSVYSANKAIKQIYDLKNQEDALRIEAQRLRITAQEKRSSYRKKHIWMPFAFLLPTTVIMLGFYNVIIESLISNGLTELANTIHSSLLVKEFGVFLLLHIAWLSVFGITFIFPCKDKKLLAEANSIDEQADNIQREINKLVAQSSKELSGIAPKYRYPAASEILVELFELGRASTLPEAYDKLEEQLHRLRLETAMAALIHAQITQLEFLGRIEFNTFWS